MSSIGWSICVVSPVLQKRGKMQKEGKRRKECSDYSKAITDGLNWVQAPAIVETANVKNIKFIIANNADVTEGMGYL